MNAGSSGGPLFASDGRVAGIIVQKRRGPGVEGIGLAVPMAEVVEGLFLDLGELHTLNNAYGVWAVQRGGMMKCTNCGVFMSKPDADAGDSTECEPCRTHG